MASSDHDKLLDQLQNEVNEVFKQIGRLFAAVGTTDNGKTLPLGHIVKLKKMLPGSNERFHAALDELEEELQMAKLVMLRDLVVCRERAGLQLPSAASATDTTTTADLPDAAEVDTVTTDALNNDTPVNVATADSEPAKAPDTTEDAEMNDANTQNDAAATENAPITEGVAESERNADAADTTNAAAEQKPDTSEPTTAPTERTLHIDTQAQIPPKDPANDNTAADEDNPPDIANFSTTNDLDSLFGGPLSAGAGEAPTNFNIDGNATSDFDFDEFAANLDPGATVDNDNISSLLPGLEDYASGAPADGEEINFDDFFPPMGGEGGDQAGIPHRDSTFDGLGDLAEFNMDDFTAGDGGGTGENEDFEFDFLK